MKKRTFFLIVLVALTAGCGYRGALYLPENPPEQQIPASEISKETNKEEQ